MSSWRRGWALAAIFLAGCSGTDPEPIEPSADQSAADVEAAVGRTFTLKVGQEARIAGSDLTVRFQAVASDSRCPADVECVWAGSARVQIVAGGGAHALNTGEEPRSARIDGHTVEVTKLDPAPHSERPISATEYVATFVVKAAGGQ
jgi:hypothetical protein